MNAIAGGGTLVTFPSLLALGADPRVANATSTVALWPGSLGSMWGYRRELQASEPWTFWLAVPSVLGGAAGAMLLLRTPSTTFAFLVPYLILFATFLFMINEPISRLLRERDTSRPPGRVGMAAVILFQTLVAVYGGYFGAGIGILMLSALSLLGIGDIHRMNGLKTLFATCINGTAAALFVYSRAVNWSQAALMIVASVLGGYLGARFARRLGARVVRSMVIAIGGTIAGVMLYKQLGG